MSKRQPILLDGKPLHAFTALEVIDIASRRGRARYDLGACADAIRNREILWGFDGKSERTSSELIAAETARHSDWSEQFCALRVGESLGWALEHRIVERVPGSHRWLLKQPERIFQTVGGRGKEHALRVRGHTDDAEAIAAMKLWKRELGRRERARLRDIEKHKPAIIRLLDRITCLAPETKLQGYIAKFAVAGFDTIGACRQYIIDSIPDFQAGDPFVIELELSKLSSSIPTPPRPEPIAAEDLAALGGLRL